MIKVKTPQKNTVMIIAVGKPEDLGQDDMCQHQRNQSPYNGRHKFPVGEFTANNIADGRARTRKAGEPMLLPKSKCRENICQDWLDIGEDRKKTGRGKRRYDHGKPDLQLAQRLDLAENAASFRLKSWKTAPAL